MKSTKYNKTPCKYCGEGESKHSANNSHCFVDYHVSSDERRILATVYTPTEPETESTLVEEVIQQIKKEINL